jgi:hypothetical protein
MILSTLVYLAESARSPTNADIAVACHLLIASTAAGAA